jgi:hypothetical protein
MTMKHQPSLPAMISVMLLFSVMAAHGQTAAEMEGLLDTGEITCAQAAYFVLAAALEDPPQNPEAAFGMALEQGWLPGNSESSGGITLGGLSLLLMKAFGIKGGLMYRIFPLDRYAYREMTSRGFIEGRSYSALKVSGEQFMGILENVLTQRERE